MGCTLEAWLRQLLEAKHSNRLSMLCQKVPAPAHLTVCHRLKQQTLQAASNHVQVISLVMESISQKTHLLSSPWCPSSASISSTCSSCLHLCLAIKGIAKARRLHGRPAALYKQHRVQTASQQLCFTSCMLSPAMLLCPHRLLACTAIS